MELIETKELYENDAFVIIEAEFEDSETKKRIQEIALGLKNNLGDITKRGRAGRKACSLLLHNQLLQYKEPSPVLCYRLSFI